MKSNKYDLTAKPANEMKFSYGGQAVIEGVMMRGAHRFAVAVRNPDGEIVIHEQPISKALYQGRISKTPFLRGLIGLWDSLGLGMRALLWSAEVAATDLADDKKAAPSDATDIATPPAEKKPTIDFNGPIGFGVVAFSLALGVGLFTVLPTAIANGIGSLLGVTSVPLLVNLIEGVVQLSILIGYIWAIGLMPDTRRLFGYHGAEHKTINAYEAGAVLTPEVVAQYPIEHPRCGTAFLLTVAFVSMLVFSIVDTILTRNNLLVTIASRVVLIPLVAGIAYEVLKWTAANVDKVWVRRMIVPNLALQHLTTREPDLTMIEVAIAAFKRVLVSEKMLMDEAPDPVPATTPIPVGD